MKTPIWASGLSAHAKAARAAKWGGIACILAAVRKILAVAMMAALSQKPWDHAAVWFIGASTIPAFIAFTGVRLLHGRGRWSGCFAALLIVLDVATADWPAVTVQLVTSVAVTAVLLLFILNGARGAFALHHIDFHYPLRETFD